MQHAIATLNNPKLNHAAITPTQSAMIPAIFDDVASIIAGKVITASVT